MGDWLPEPDDLPEPELDDGPGPPPDELPGPELADGPPELD